MGCGCAGSTRRPAASNQGAGAKQQANGTRADAGYTWNGPKRKPAATAPAK